MQRKFSWHSFLAGRKKKYGMCFCTWHFLQFSSHLAQSGVGCLWPPPSTSTFTDNYTTTQAKGHTKLLRILIQYTYIPSLEYGQCSALNIFLFKVLNHKNKAWKQFHRFCIYVHGYKSFHCMLIKWNSQNLAVS